MKKDTHDYIPASAIILNHQGQVLTIQQNHEPILPWVSGITASEQIEHPERTSLGKLYEVLSHKALINKRWLHYKEKAENPRSCHFPNKTDGQTTHANANFVTFHLLQLTQNVEYLGNNFAWMSWDDFLAKTYGDLRPIYADIHDIFRINYRIAELTAQTA